MRVSEIRAVGIGELLARIERLRQLLDAEGLFDPRLKRPIPFLPDTIGLITGRASAAERDVMTVAAGRWPAVRFAVRNTVVQGPNAVPQIVEALRELDGDPDVDVIVIARGGGSVEDLLPFSDETLCRAIAACTTPVVSAIGHEPDNPLCDLVADLRAATPPTPPNASSPTPPPNRRWSPICAGAAHAPCATGCTASNTRCPSCAAARCWPSRWPRSPPAPTRSTGPAPPHAATSPGWWPPRSDRIGHLSARLTTLGPAATLARGYAVVQAVGQAGTPAILRSTADAPAGHPAAGTGGRRRRHGGQRRSRRGTDMKPISQMGYEEARDELIEVVQQLEQGGLDLDASLKLWERGEELAKCCEEHLAGARKRVEDALAAKDADES